MMQRLFSPIAVLALAAVLVAPIRFPAQPPAPELTAEAWVLMAADSGVTIAAHNADEERAMASVTKLMTALVVRDQSELTARIRVSEAAADVGEAEVGLVAGEVWSVRDLLAAVLVRSGNDAAFALAEHIGGSIEGFSELMNAKAESLGLEHSHFLNPHGLDEEGHYTSANDLADMAIAVLEDPVLTQLTRTRLIRFKPAPTGEDRISRNTNILLGRYPGVAGMKTGFTGEAGRVLVSVLEAEGRIFVGVVMGSEDHFADTAALFDYVTGLVSVRDRFLAPLVEQEGGGGVGAAPLDDVRQRAIKTLPELPTGIDQTSPWGETPGTHAIAEMIRTMLPVTLGGTG